MSPFPRTGWRHGPVLKKGTFKFSACPLKVRGTIHVFLSRPLVRIERAENLNVPFSTRWLAPWPGFEKGDIQVFRLPVEGARDGSRFSFKTVCPHWTGGKLESPLFSTPGPRLKLLSPLKVLKRGLSTFPCFIACLPSLCEKKIIVCLKLLRGGEKLNVPFSARWLAPWPGLKKGTFKFSACPLKVRGTVHVFLSRPFVRIGRAEN